MKRLPASLLVALPMLCTAADYESTLLVQTGKLRESDLIVRTISDLQSNKICLAFYVRTAGTSSVMTCYDAVTGFRSNVNQVGFFKEVSSLSARSRISRTGYLAWWPTSRRRGQHRRSTATRVPPLPQKPSFVGDTCGRGTSKSTG